MKALLAILMIFIVTSCTNSFSSDKYSASKKHVPAVREFLINELELTDSESISFIKSTFPEMKEVNAILYYWFNDSNGKTIYTVQAQPGKDFFMFEAIKN